MKYGVMKLRQKRTLGEWLHFKEKTKNDYPIKKIVMGLNRKEVGLREILRKNKKRLIEYSFHFSTNHIFETIVSEKKIFLIQTQATEETQKEFLKKVLPFMGYDYIGFIPGRSRSSYEIKSTLDNVINNDKIYSSNGIITYRNDEDDSSIYVKAYNHNLYALIKGSEKSRELLEETIQKIEKNKIKFIVS